MKWLALLIPLFLVGCDNSKRTFVPTPEADPRASYRISVAALTLTDAQLQELGMTTSQALQVSPEKRSKLAKKIFLMITNDNTLTRFFTNSTMKAKAKMKFDFESGIPIPHKSSTSSPMVFDNCKGELWLERVDTNGWGSFGYDAASYSWYEPRDGQDEYGGYGSSLDARYIQLGHAEMIEIQAKEKTSLWFIIGFAPDKIAN